MLRFVCLIAIGVISFTNSQCSNAYSQCSTWAAAGFCSNTYYTTAQRYTYCQLSCGLCTYSTGSTAASSACANLNSNCATWVANGFCNNTAYTAAQRASFCPSSCGLCSTTTASTTASTTVAGKKK